MNSELAPWEILIRLLAAVVMGVVLGVNRDLQGKPTGMRTLGLVGLGAAVITVSTLYLTTIQSDAGAVSRVLQGLIQGIFTGIGFLGAGAVLRKEPDGQVHGLTTAANVLVVAGLGIACGIGAWWTVLIGAGLALVLLAVLQPVEKRLEDKARKLPKAEEAD
jgi:putative Mg2+ transporter-C (MgtC) family protein